MRRLVSALLLALAGVGSGTVDMRRVAFTVVTNDHGLAPAVFALLRAREYYPDSAFFVAGHAEAWFKTNERDHGPNKQLLQMYEGTIRTLNIPAKSEPLLLKIRKLVYAVHPTMHWPIECFMWAIVPQKLAKLGFDFTVSIDADVMANDGQLVRHLPHVAGIGIVRMYAKECNRADLPIEFERHAHRMPGFHDPAYRAALVEAAGEHGYEYNRDGTNSGFIVFNNTRMVEVNFTGWCYSVIVAVAGQTYGDQELLNLAIGRQDIHVYYLPSRFNVQLAYPHKEKDTASYMSRPFCAYGQAAHLMASMGRAGMQTVSFAHFVWTLKPWNRKCAHDMSGTKRVLDEGGKLGMSYVIFTTPIWVNEWRSFVNRTVGTKLAVRFFGGKSGLDEEDFLNPIEEFSFAYIQEVLKCIGPEVESCHMKREHEDELLPDGYDDLSSLSAVLRPLDFRGGWLKTGTAARELDSRDPQALQQFLTATKRLEHVDVSSKPTNLTAKAPLDDAAGGLAPHRRRLAPRRRSQIRDDKELS